MLSIPAQHISKEILEKFETAEWKHASAILTKDFSAEWKEIQEILLNFRFTRNQVYTPGGNMTVIAESIHERFDAKGWKEKKFNVAILIDGVERSADTHQVDHYKGRVAVETEWNSKDSVFDRDLKNFRLLAEMAVISVGIIITRADSLQELFKGFGLGGKYGASTTHMSKLLEEVNAGTAGGCPLLMFGITAASYDEDEISLENLQRLEKKQNDRLAKSKAKSEKALHDSAGRSAVEILKPDGKNSP